MILWSERGGEGRGGEGQGEGRGREVLHMNTNIVQEHNLLESKEEIILKGSGGA